MITRQGVGRATHGPVPFGRALGGLLVALPISLGLALCGTAQAETTITAVMNAPLRSLDPVTTTAYILRDYGYMVYDTLLSTDANGDIKPQMVDNWKVSPDGKTYTFTLRDGLKWHDGKPVTAADCIASIKRWAAQDKAGQIMMSLVTSMDKINDKSFSMTFGVPTDVALRALGKPGSLVPFMMPERIAETPPTQPITEAIGSGPFKFVKDQYRPGVQAVFVKNKDYVPRREPPSDLAGGHVVKVDRVRWVAMPDAMTAVNAIKSGEIDYIERTPHDLLPILEKDDQLRLIISKKQGGSPVLRLNHAQPPFNNKLVRQAAMAAIDQNEIMQAYVGNPKYYQTCGAVLGCDSKYGSTEGSKDLIKADPEKSKALLKEAGYDGAPVVLLHPMGFGNIGFTTIPIVAQELRRGGFKVDIQDMDWQTLLIRRTSKKPVAEGGWSGFTTLLTRSDIQDPVSNFSIAANGDKAWFGWPNVPEIETLRRQFASTQDEKELKSLAVRIQKLVMDDGVVLPLGEYAMVVTTRKSLKGVLDAPVPVFWNIEKTGS
ncbi:MAG: ABC transporter substrate-binding protein [Candidimonas sp.]|nr:MAG: ABC transporter substrate-binding protein [Candidimonas sp.]